MSIMKNNLDLDDAVASYLVLIPSLFSRSYDTIHILTSFW